MVCRGKTPDFRSEPRSMYRNNIIMYPLIRFLLYVYTYLLRRGNKNVYGFDYWSGLDVDFCGDGFYGTTHYGK